MAIPNGYEEMWREIPSGELQVGMFVGRVRAISNTVKTQGKVTAIRRKGDHIFVTVNLYGSTATVDMGRHVEYPSVVRIG